MICKCNSKHFQTPRQSMCEWTSWTDGKGSQVHASLAWLLTNPTLDPQELVIFAKPSLEAIWHVISYTSFGVHKFSRSWSEALFWACHFGIATPCPGPPKTCWAPNITVVRQLQCRLFRGATFLFILTSEKPPPKPRFPKKRPAQWLQSVSEMGYKLRNLDHFRKSDGVFSASSPSCWYLFLDTNYFLHILVCGFMPRLMPWRIPFSSCFSNRSALGLSNSTRSFSPDSMLPGSCPEPPWFHVKVPSLLFGRRDFYTGILFLISCLIFFYKYIVNALTIYVGVSLNGGTPKTPENDHF